MTATYREQRVRDMQGLARRAEAKRSPKWPDGFAGTPYAFNSNGTGFLLGMNTITGRQPLNLTPAQVFEMEKALAKIAPDVRVEREAAARQAQFENARSAYMWQQAGQFTLNATAGVLNNIATTLYAVPAPGIACTTNAMAATAYTNMVANGRNWVKAFNNEFSEYPSNGAPAGAKPSIGGALAGSMPENWQIARGLAQGIDGMPMASTPMAMLSSGGVRAGAGGFLSSPENINGIINAATGIQINALTNPNVNWINTATAGVSNYAMGYMGTKFGMQTAPPLSVQFGRGALVGVLGDIGAQGLEKLIDPTYKEFDAFRTVMNMGATSLGTGFNAMMPSNAANAYASWAITKYPTIFSGLKTYTANKTSQ